MEYRHFAAAIVLVGMTSIALPALAADTGFRIELSEQTGLATIRYGDETIAASKFEPATRYVSEPAYYRTIRRGWRCEAPAGLWLRSGADATLRRLRPIWPSRRVWLRI